MTSAGDLIHRLQLQQRDPAKNALREQSKAWVNVVELPCRFYPVRARVFDAAAAEQSEVTMKVRIRHRPGITGDMRILWLGEGGDAPYDIESVIPVRGQFIWLDLMCKNGVRDGRNPV